MKNRYLKSLTARVTILMLSFLCLAGSQGAGTGHRTKRIKRYIE